MNGTSTIYYSHTNSATSEARIDALVRIMAHNQALLNEHR